MFDAYYDKVMAMDSEKLLDERTNVEKKLRTAAPGSGIALQLIDMLEAIDMAFAELTYREKISTEPSVMNIGEMESVTTEPDYTNEELLIAIVDGYTKEPNNEGSNSLPRRED